MPVDVGAIDTLSESVEAVKGREIESSSYTTDSPVISMRLSAYYVREERVDCWMFRCRPFEMPNAFLAPVGKRL